jgi:hypothetical protein
MIWSEEEACAKQVTQIATSACGATAAVNVLVHQFCILILQTVNFFEYCRTNGARGITVG